MDGEKDAMFTKTLKEGTNQRKGGKMQKESESRGIISTNVMA